MSKIGIQSQNGTIPDFTQVAGKQPVAWLLLGNALGLTLAKDIRARSPNTIILLRTGNDWAYRDDAYNQAYIDTALQMAAPFQQAGVCDFLLPPNEPVAFNDVDARALNAAQVKIANAFKANGYKTGAYNFSVGNPQYALWQYLLDGLRACDNWLFLHEYGMPTKPPGDLQLRHRNVFPLLPADIQANLKIGITECGWDLGIDSSVFGHAGGYRSLPDNGHLIEDYIAYLQGWDAELAKDAYVKFSTIFGYSMLTPWTTLGFDVAQDDGDRAKFIAFLSSGIIQPPQETFKFTHYPFDHFVPVTQGFGENPAYYQQFGFPGHEGIDFGAATNTKVLSVADGTVVEVVNSGNYGLHVRVNHIDNYQTVYAHLGSAAVAVNQVVKSGDLLGLSDTTGNATGPHLHLTMRKLNATYTDPSGNVWPSNVFDPTNFVNAVTPPIQPPTGGLIVTPFVMPDAIKPFATAVPYVPAGTELFYRLSPKAYVHPNVSAFVNIVVLDENGVPEIGTQVVNIRPDGKGEMSVTSGAGTVQFNFGAGGAFSNPGEGPYKVFMAEGVSIPTDPPFYVSWSKILGDQIGSLGDWQGLHTEIYLQFRKMHADVNYTPANLEEAIRYPAYTFVGRGAKYNPAAGLQNTARRRGMGAVLTDEFYILWNNVQYVCQGFTKSILVTAVGHYADSDFFEVVW